MTGSPEQPDAVPAPVSSSDLRALWASDRQRQDAGLVDALLDPTLRYLFAYRAAVHLRASGHRLLLAVVKAWLRRARWRFGLDLHLDARIGPGLFLSRHPGGIVVNPGARIGANCNLNHGVTIGQANRGERAGAPTLGDRVWVGPGAKVVGAVTVGSHALIGPNAVVSQDVEAGAVVGSPRPAVLSHEGSADYVTNVAAQDEAT